MIDPIQNSSTLWRALLPVKTNESHKYNCGSVIIYGASELTGATRLAASACARMGTGLVTVLADPAIANVYRTALPPHILVRDDLMWEDGRTSAKLYGPGGLPVTPDFLATIPVVLDAAAFIGMPDLLSDNFILTPHEGEFARLFPDLKGTRLERAGNAAQKKGAYIVLKGPETIISAPDGRIVINTQASPYLATAGTGDVLAGMITGLVSQNMPLFEACCAAVWMHSDAAASFGPGLVATDLIDLIPNVFCD